MVEAAQAAASSGDLARAIGSYRELAALAPIAAVHNNLGLVLARDGQLDAAVRAFRAALEDGDSAAVLVNLGNALRRGGDKASALAAYQRAIELDPACAPAHYNLHAALYDASRPDAAIATLERALALRPDHLDTRFYLGALRALHESPEDDGLDALPDACTFLVESLRYVEGHKTRETALFADTFDTLRFALGRAPRAGAVIELGVRRGTTLRFLASLSPPPVYGFDTFEGLPEAWGDQPAGLYTTQGELPEVPDHVTLVRGAFADTLPHFAAQLDTPVRLLHVDCDLYASTRDALTVLAPHLGRGTIIVFDEYLCNPGWQDEERRAFLELGVPYDYLAFSLFTKQAVVRLI